MASYCCFIDPEKGYENRKKDDLCPKCGRPYGFPLTDHPESIEKYKIIKPLDRGFYSVSYVAETGPFNRRRVVKVVPKPIYDFFNKNFEFECSEHARAEEGSAHIVRIHDIMMNVNVTFRDITIPCHIAELDYVEGESLRTYLDSSEPLEAIDIAQIAMDLFTLMSELHNKQIYHNDLQPENLIIAHLPPENKRADAESPFIKLVGIDLNSISDGSISDEQRRGDLRWIVTHLKVLVDKLLNPVDTNELNFRLASILEEQACIISPEATSQRMPSFDECIANVRNAIRQPRAPWRDMIQLRRFSDAYNAQTLNPWFIPYLLIDPDEKWLSAISIRGPQVITGLRGCGKTMLIKALEFHARAKAHEKNGQENIADSLREDGYIGLYVSSTKLMEIEVTGEVRHPFEKLFTAYALQALRALNHLRDLNSDVVYAASYQQIGKAVSEYLEGAEGLSDTTSEFVLESKLINIMVELNRGVERYKLNANPALVFDHLADAICNCSSIWSNSTVYYLLDDVSTRYLTEKKIITLISSLIFSQSRCAFKMTTEAQTFELILLSPGLIEMARIGRDYEVFDLGEQVLDLTRRRGAGISFVEDILENRSKYYPQSPGDVKALQILGDTSLKSIALNIGKTAATSRERKKVYWGITALTRACVGDIGDIIRIYESIITYSKKSEYPIDPKVQTQCYHDFCNARLHDLNRKKSWLKDHTLAFAQASYDLLMQSYIDYVSNGNKGRIRQYLKIYVRITVGDTDKQLKQIRELIDAGVFVLDGGAYRKKTRDADPVQQFILTFRKLYGLSNFIGISERDRFELSGEDLSSWLDTPDKEILKRNLVKDISKLVIEDEEDYEEPPVEAIVTKGSTQLKLFKTEVDEATSKERAHQDVVNKLIKSKTPVCKLINVNEINEWGIDNLVLGLGFEERTLESAKRILKASKPSHVICLKHNDAGRTQEILSLVNENSDSCYQMTIEEFMRSSESSLLGNTLIDITGLTKSMIFHSVRNAILSNRQILVCHTQAIKHYPLDEDIEKVLIAQKEGDYYSLLEEMGKILIGEISPYKLEPLLISEADNTRRRILFAFASAKHERLLSLLDERAYDNVQLVAQNPISGRGKIARLSAEFASQNYPNAEVIELTTDNLLGAIDEILRSYHYWYVDNGYNFEIGLTGSKLQTVASAIVSAICKFSYGWYVRPSDYDKMRFTQGVAETMFFHISLKDET